jgi:hypothetical protein
VIGGVKVLKQLFAKLLEVLLTNIWRYRNSVKFGSWFILRNRFCKISVGEVGT